MHGFQRLRFPHEKTVPHPPAWKGVGLLAGLALTAWIGRSVWPRSLEQDPDLHETLSGSFRVPLTPQADGLDLHRATDLLVETLVQIESAGDPLRVGSWGERGLMQIRPGTWSEVSRRHLGEELPFDLAFDPAANRQVGRLYLGDLQVYLYRNRHRWNSDLRSLIFASYNAGPQRVRNAGFDVRRLPRGVRDYVQRASALHDWHLAHDAARLHVVLREARGETPP